MDLAFLYWLDQSFIGLCLKSFHTCVPGLLFVDTPPVQESVHRTRLANCTISSLVSRLIRP